MATITHTSTQLLQVTVSQDEIEELEEAIELASTICGGTYYLEINEDDEETVSNILGIQKNILSDTVLQITTF